MARVPSKSNDEQNRKRSKKEEERKGKKEGGRIFFKEDDMTPHHLIISGLINSNINKRIKLKRQAPPALCQMQVPLIGWIHASINVLRMMKRIISYVKSGMDPGFVLK